MSNYLNTWNLFPVLLLYELSLSLFQLSRAINSKTILYKSETSAVHFLYKMKFEKYVQKWPDFAQLVTFHMQVFAT